MKNRALMFDGMKAVDLWNGDRGWDVLSGPSDQSQARMTADDYRRSVPWFFRGVEDRSTTLTKIPFAVVNPAGTDVDNSGTWQDEMKLFPHPRRLLHQVEASLVMTGRAYLFLETNDFGYVSSVKYCLPTSVKEKYDPNTNELLCYVRTVGTRSQEVACSNIVAIYVPDYTVEDGPASSSAARAALMAAGVLFNADMFIAQYFARGAIKATILNVDTADQREAVRLQAWWEDVVSGIKNAWSAIVLRSKMATPTVIGEGLEGLQNTDLTKEKRQDISTAIGVPESRMWSSAANYATAEVEDKKYYEDVIIPDALLIEEAINSQLFTEEHKLAGWRWEFRPETGGGFSKDEQARSAAYVGYVGTGMLPSVAAQLVGIELPGEMEYEDLDPEETLSAVSSPLSAREEEVTATELPAPAPEAPEAVPMAMDKAAMRSALFQWKAAALAAVKTGHSAGIDFDHPAIPDNMAEFLRYELEAATDGQTVNELFKKAREMVVRPSHSSEADPTLMLARELQRANDLLEREGTKAVSAERESGPSFVINNVMPNAAPPTVHVAPADVKVSMPQQSAPVIQVNVPQQAAPIVNVTTPDVTVNVPQPAPVEFTVRRDYSGKINGGEIG